MADIKTKCKDCGKEMFVSEYAEEVVCSNCGSSFRVKDDEEEKQIAQEKKDALKARSDYGSEGIPQTLSVNEILVNSLVSKKKNVLQGLYFRAAIACLSVGIVSSICNYTDFLPPSAKSFLETHMPWLFIVLHIFIILAAFKDNVFDGVLSLIIPPYAYYYIFFKSDEYMFKAIFLGLLIGYGGNYFRFLIDSSDNFITWGNRMLDGEY
jgi:DNA-directed RNA polymerase subunit RPC12/RpoP